MFSVEVTTHSWESSWEMPAAVDGVGGATRGEGELTEDFDFLPFLALAGGDSPSLYFLQPTGRPLFLGTFGVLGLDTSTPAAGTGAGAGAEDVAAVEAGVAVGVEAEAGVDGGSNGLAWSAFTMFSARASLSREFRILSASESPGSQ